MRFLLLILSVCIYAQPTVTCTGTDAQGEPRGANYIGSTYAQINCTISGTPYYSWVEYGTSTGVYPDRTKTVSNMEGNGQTPSVQIRLAMGGLKASTLYYVRAGAQPNVDNRTGAGYSAEFTFTTLAEDAVSPPYPTMATPYTPGAINTAGYTVVTLKRCASGFACADGAVASLGIANEATLQAVYDAATYTNGTLIQAPVGLDTNVEFVAADGNRGYNLPSKAVQAGKSGIDDATHNWIVTETAGCDTTANFPPFGSRIDPTFAGKTWTLRATTPSSRGQHFEAPSNAGITHHYAFRCLNLETPTPGATEANPFTYKHAIYISQNALPEPNLKYFIIDRVIVAGTTATGPKRQYGGLHSGAAYTSIIGSDVRTGIWLQWQMPTASITIGGTGNRTITLGSGSGAEMKVTATSNVLGCSSGAVAVVTSLGATGKWVLAMTPSGCKFYYSAAAVTLSSCTNCTGSSFAGDPDVETIAIDEFPYSRGTFSSAGAMSLTYTASGFASLGAPTWGGGSYDLAFGIEVGSYDVGPFTIQNNYVETPGIGFYLDSGYGGYAYDTVNGLTRMNWFNLPPQYQWNHASTNGRNYKNRQHWEIKRGRQWLVVGNRFTGLTAETNAGPSIFLSGRPNYLPNIGNMIADIEIRSNVIAHAPQGWDCSVNNPRSADPVPNARIWFHNNSLYSINSFLHSAPSGSKLNSSYYAAFSACQDVRINNNTHGLSVGLGPVISLIGGDDLRGGKHAVTDNVFYASKGDSGCSRFLLINDSTAINTTYPSLPAVSGADAKAIWDSYFASVAGGVVTATNIFSNNVMVGGKCSVDASNISDLSQVDTTALASAWKTGNLWPAGNTLALRESAAGFSTATNSMLPTSPYYRASANKFNAIGHNPQVLTQEMGIVTGISISPGATFVTATYLAPDTRACRLDVTANGGTTWSSTTDAGGSPYRVTSVAGLLVSTAYTWRLLCYYQQVNDGRQWDDWATSQITAGSTTTLASSGGSRTVTYVLPAVTGASKYQIVFTLADGTTSTATSCTASPCTVSFPATAVLMRPNILSAADAVLLTGSLIAVTPGTGGAPLIAWSDLTNAWSMYTGAWSAL